MKNAIIFFKVIMKKTKTFILVFIGAFSLILSGCEKTPFSSDSMSSSISEPSSISSSSEPSSNSSSSDAIALSQVFDWINNLKLEDIASARYTESAIGNPNFSNFNKHYLANNEEIASLYSYLKNKTVALTDYRIPPGAQAISLSITTKDNQTYRLATYNNRLYGNSMTNSYLLDEPLPHFSTLWGYSFDPNSLMNLCVSDPSSALRDVSDKFNLSKLNDLVFKETNQEVTDNTRKYNKYEFYNSYGNFKFEAEKVFNLYDENTSKQTTYEIINDLGFSDIKKSS